MQLGTEKYSYRSGELHLNSRRAIAKEIDSILLEPKVDIATLSRDEYVELLRAEFLARGWENPSPSLVGRGTDSPLMDFYKEKVGVQLGFHSTSLEMDILKLQAAFSTSPAYIDLGVYVSGTGEFQKQLRNETLKPWSGPTFHAAIRKLPTLARMVEIPICCIGLEIVEATEHATDLDAVPLSKIKAILLEFLSEKYGESIDQDVSVMGAGAELGFDGIMRIDDTDVILVVELSKTGGVLRSKLLADSTYSLANSVRKYQQASGRKASLRFILLGDFSTAYIQSVLGNNNSAYGWAEDVEVTYELYTFEELAIYMENKENTSEN
ncbi:MAG: BglII/BstYI family type II restriction endonuclease [Chloroflexota bacterium]|nr:BglII/BstYI family type II restriction endonuclease [Chloroflexota bacterium]